MAGTAPPAPAPGGRDSADADALGAAGIPVRLEVGELVALGDVTGGVEPVESYAAKRFLPLIAQRDRRAMLNALRYYQRHNHFGSYLRLAVVTSGQRLPLDLRGRMQELHRRISRFAHEARNRFAVEVVYRGTEFAVDQAFSFHVHANLLYAPRGALAAHGCGEFLRWMHHFFGAHVHDAGPSGSPRRRSNIRSSRPISSSLEGPALAWVYRETRRLKHAQPLGAFADFWRALRNQRHKVLLVDGPDGAKLRLVEKPRRPVCPGGRRTRRRGEPAPENEVLCRMAPQSRFSPRAEPVSLVRNYTTNPKTWEGLLRLEEINADRRQARAWWNASGAGSRDNRIPSA